MTERDEGSVPAWRGARLRLTPSAIALVLGAVAVAVVARVAFVAAHRQIGWGVASLLVAALLVPVADWFDRYVPRWLALLGTMLSLAAVTALAWVGVVSNVQDGLTTLENQAPEAARELEAKYQVARDFRLVERVEVFIESVKDRSEGSVGQTAGTAGTYFVCGILTLFLLIYAPRMMRAGLDQVRDPKRRRRVEWIVLTTLKRARGYLLVTLVQGLVIGGIVGLVAYLLDLPAPFILGLLAGALGTIPTIGILVGGLPALLLAAGLGEPGDAWILLGLLILLQGLEIHVVRRRIDEATVHVGPALPSVVALLGYELYGVGGAAYGAALLVFLIAWLDTIGYDADPEPG